MKSQLLQVTKQKEKKIKPIKQPSKLQRPSILTEKNAKQDDTLPRGQRDKPKHNQIAGSSAPDPHKNNNRESICSHLLETGSVQSFIDLFYISHKCLPNVMEKKNYFGEKLHIPDLPSEDEATLQFYNEFASSLAKAEVRPDSSRGDKEAAMNEYNSIAFNYEDQGDFVTASYFYQKVVELANSCKNRQFELVALLGLGKCHDQGKKRDSAIEILQDAFDNASTLQSKEQRGEMVRLIGKELMEIYIEKAEELVKIDMVYALKTYQSGLAVAQRAGEKESQARISHKIGQLYYLQGQFDRSVAYQEQYLTRLKQSIEEELARDNDEGLEKKDNQNSLKFKEMQAHASLAKCYLKLKDIVKAELHLNEYHRMAKQAKVQNSVADSSYYLAKLNEEKGEKERAIAYYQSYFQAAKSEKPEKKDRRLVDKARVTYAIAKAGKNMQKYINLFEGESSLRNVLEWKIKRVLK